VVPETRPRSPGGSGLAGLLCMGMLWLTVNAAPAGGQLFVGVQGDWASETRIGLGARASGDLSFLLRRLEIIGYGDRYFPGDTYGAEASAWEAGVALVYRLAAPEARLLPYAGIGISYSSFRVAVPLAETEISGGESLWGVNLLAGLLLPGHPLVPFFEGRYTASDQSQMVISAGVGVGIGSAWRGRENQENTP